MIIDFHTHAFPDFLAPKAIASLKQNIGTEPHFDGTVSGLISKMDHSCVDMSVVCNIATNPRQTDNVNAFAMSSPYPERILPLGSVHPLNENIEKTLKELKNNGIKGIKIHPDFMGFDINDRAFDTVFEIASAEGLFVVTHAGFDALSPDHVHATPKMISEVLERFPDLTLIAAHFGGNMMWDDAEEYLCGKKVYIDTSLPDGDRADPRDTLSILNRHDPEMILFGSDSPWCDVKSHINVIDGLVESPEIKDKIFYKNALRLIKNS